MHVKVDQGALTVDLQEAPIQEVLTAIGQEAGLRVRMSTTANRTVSARFAAMPLDQGLRRLLRVASLSYALLYTQGPTATAILQEVRVFGEARREEVSAHDEAPLRLAQRARDRLTPPTQEERAETEPTGPEPEADATAEPEAEPEIPED
jgi:hypothetical protein